MDDKINTVILAAGKGTRLKVNIPKPLCPILGRTLIDFVIDNLKNFTSDNNVDNHIGLVVGHEKEKVTKYVDDNFEELGKSFSWQKEQLGTGHALQSFFKDNPNAWNNKFTLVVCADTPLIDKDIYSKIFKKIREDNIDAVCASFMTENPNGYGRIVKGEKGFKIVEEKDASDKEREITEVNSGLYIFRTEFLKQNISSLNTNNKSNELYLTDMFKIGSSVFCQRFKNEERFLGVNNLYQLSIAEQFLLAQNIKRFQMEGVRFLKPDSCYIENNVKIEPGVVIHANVSLYGNSQIKADCVIGSGSVLIDSYIDEKTYIKPNSHLEQAQVGRNCSIGPMARLREKSYISDNCKLGNFVETKKVQLSNGVKVSHLSYLGDAEVGENTNIGCGFVTCNYDGASKHKTLIGKNSFIGSDCQVIAPIRIGDEVYIGSGSTINKDIPTGDFAIARQRQVNKNGMAHKFLKKK